MKSQWIMFTIGIMIVAGFAHADILNGDFELGDNASHAANWADIEIDNASNVYYVPGGDTSRYADPWSRALTIKGYSGATGSQQILGVVQDSYTFNFDAGFRNDAVAGSADLVVSIWDTVAGAALASETITVSASGTVGQSDPTWGNWNNYTVTLNIDTTDVTEVALRFINNAGGTWQNSVIVDNVSWTNSPALPVRLVAPAYGHPNELIDADSTLEWLSGTDPDIIQHVLYFSTDQNWVATALPTDTGAVVLDVTTETYLHDESLAYEMTYYWRVDEATGSLNNLSKVETGPVWNFTTQSVPPPPAPPCADYGFNGDVNGDCHVDMNDLILLTQDWMQTSVVSAADISEDTNVNYADFAYISRDWLTDIQPPQHKIMFISAHPDDEAIFFGGTVAYYPQVLNVPVVHISTTSGDWFHDASKGLNREADLTRADTIYFGWDVITSIGLVPDPSADLHFLRFDDISDSSYPSVDQIWDWWNNHEYDDGADSVEGKQKVVDTLATYIRVFKPAVIATHDFDGEYGHSNHKATAIGVADAYDRAADPSYVDGNAPWQTKKLYIHQSEANGLGTAGYTFTGFLFHDYCEDVTIDTDGNGVPDMTPRQVADLGVDEHGGYDVSTVYRTGENFDGHHSEWWGLYRSTVGPDTIADDFTIAGTTYSGWSIGNFFENLGN